MPMAVYFVYRSQYGAPGERHVRRFEDDTVLDWAKVVWKEFNNEEAAKRYAAKLFGGMPLDELCRLFWVDEEFGMSHPPHTMADVKRWFAELYCEEEAHGPHHIQCLTDWSDNQRAVYVFDDHYRAKKPGKADFLLLDGWELPAGEADGPKSRLPKTRQVGDARGEGALYFAGTFLDCRANLEDLGSASHIKGLRLPDLARYLLSLDDLDEGEYELILILDGLRGVLAKPKGEEAGFLKAIRDRPDDLTSWGAYSDWLQDRDLPPAGLHLLNVALGAKKFRFARGGRKPELDFVRVTAHAAQACKHLDRGKRSRARQVTHDDRFTQFIFFDDRWAAAHPTLAAGVLTFASRWDVLT
jgi:uncharacterized protein (TIGR02996 family)